ncbi:hypothetical protein F7I85_05160 [Salmonella enterica]|nr:hypothetical protein [Salmonella enterica]EGL8932911.1 hypothetical protein [Salmonella enterica]
MTTNNHPANGPVSLERLHQIREILSKAAAQSDGGNLGYAMADAVKVIDGAIAVFDEKPVAYIFKHPSGRLFWALTDESNKGKSDVMPVYAAPRPAPVVPEWANEQCLEFLSIAFRHAEIKGDLEFDDIRLGMKMVNESRDAMLQLYGNSEQLDEVGSWNNHRNTPTAQAGNSPVIPDGWQLVPKEPTEAMNKAGWAAMNEHDAINPTYRAMLAAAPQQEVNP